VKYDIQVNPLNPVEYLACCGVFEILSRFDRTALSYWELEPQPRFWIESEIDEASLLDCITATLSNWKQWQEEEKTPNGVSTEEEIEESQTEGESDGNIEAESEEVESEEIISLSPTFYLNGKRVCFILDWWYETLTSQKKGKPSAWRLFTGQLTIDKIIKSLTSTAKAELETKSCRTFTELLKSKVRLTKRFRFDPRSFGRPLDTGHSANDLKKFKDPAYKPVENYLFSELLATFAVQYFFPNRTKQGGGVESTRGWTRQERQVTFGYGVWLKPFPVSLARAVCIGATANLEDVTPLISNQESLGSGTFKYKNLMMAKKATIKTKK
jgi:CRISPR-associated protein Csb3